MLVAVIIEVIILEKSHVFGSQQRVESEFVELNGFEVAGLFARPGIDVGYFDLSVVVDENVFGFDITQLDGALPDFVEGVGESEKSVPEFRLLEVFVLCPMVANEFGKEVGIVGIFVLNGWRVTVRDPVFPQRPASELYLVRVGMRRYPLGSKLAVLQL